MYARYAGVSEKNWMGAYTNKQMFARLFALALGVLGGLCQTIWSQVVSLNCEPTSIGEFVFHTECHAWTELFLSFPQDAPVDMVSIVLAGAIAGFVAGAGAMWKPNWAAILFLGLAMANLAIVAGAVAVMDQDKLAVALGLLSIAVPLVCAGVAWRWGEFRGPSVAARQTAN